jgi:hypothetical protein
VKGAPAEVARKIFFSDLPENFSFPENLHIAYAPAKG